MQGILIQLGTMYASRLSLEHVYFACSAVAYELEVRDGGVKLWRSAYKANDAIASPRLEVNESTTPLQRHIRIIVLFLFRR